jgi:hypothetical protein
MLSAELLSLEGFKQWERRFGAQLDWWWVESHWQRTGQRFNESRTCATIKIRPLDLRKPQPGTVTVAADGGVVQGGITGSPASGKWRCPGSTVAIMAPEVLLSSVPSSSDHEDYARARTHASLVYCSGKP